MEMLIGVKGSEEGDIAAKFGSCSASLEQVPDPVVYKLVRVDFDGRLVPATDDELLEVENLLDLEKSDVLSVSDIVESAGPCLDTDDTSEKASSLEFKGSLLHKNVEVEQEKVKARNEETLVTSSLSLDNIQVNQAGNNMESSDVKVGPSKSRSAGLKPDFSLLNGEIDLDRLTIRELQETFRAAFGRETSIKDKLWLKRRIAMGLTNSCDVSVTSFKIKDGNLLEKRKESCKNLDYEDPMAGEVCSARDDMRVTNQSDMEDTIASSEVRNYSNESGHGSDDILDHRGAKRVRKPTKRYIEESSDKETKCNLKMMPLANCLEQHKVSSGSPFRSGGGAHAGAIVTRPDSIGGSGIRVPYVSRVRRCRPRKSIMALTNFQPREEILMGRITEPSNPQSDSLDEDKVVEHESDPLQEPKSLGSGEEKEKCCLTGASDISQDQDQDQDQDRTDVDSGGDTLPDNVVAVNSNDSLAIVPTVKGGMRRKHHRAWTLTEVVKLVDGVSKFGAGRWSEIKRLSFSSSSYRTSVDLKDKWRNLLKASLANPQADKVMNPRKNIPSPVPAPILMKVRELSETNGHAHRVLKANSGTEENDGARVNGSRPGYL